MLSKNGVLKNAVEYTSSSGSYLYKKDGTRILDACSGAVVANIGHGNRAVAQIAAKTLESITYIHPEDITPQRLKLVKELCEHWLPNIFSKMLFFNSGSEAIEAAVKAVIHYHTLKGNGHNKSIILAQDIAYHGATYFSFSLSSNHAFHDEIKKFLKPISRIPIFRGSVSLEKAWSSFSKSIESIGPDNIAAIFAETIVGSSGGILIPPAGYWEKVRQYCNDHDILLVFDEVMTGFGRTGKCFAFEHYNITPDIIVSGKGLACGYAPICGLFLSDLISEKLIESDIFIMSPTCGAHNTSCAVASTSLRIIREENLIENVRSLGQYLEKRLKELINLKLVVEIRGKGLLWGIEIGDSILGAPNNENIVYSIHKSMMERGISLYIGGKKTGYPAIIVAPPFVITVSEIDQIVDNLKQVITSHSALV